MRLPGGLKIGIVIVAAIGLLGFGAGATLASIPASAGTINACYSTATGALRVIDYPSHHCTRGERLLRWNQTSAAGSVPLLALEGTACSAIGGQGTVYVDVTAGTGAVTITCKTLLSVHSAVTLTTIDLSAGPSLTSACSNATSCSLLVPYGTTSGQVTITSTADFLYTCPGARAAPGTPDVTRTHYLGVCLGITMTGDQVVVVSAP
jgi:hypothetical protein